MANTIHAARGICNGHWERSESRSAWLLMLVRLSVAELHLIGEMAREAARRRAATYGSRAELVDAAHQSFAAH